MNLLSSVKRSINKTRLQSKLIEELQKVGIDDKNAKYHEVFDEYISLIKNDKFLGDVWYSHDVTDEEAFDYMIMLLFSTDGWYNNQFIPVSIFGFPKSLDFILTEIEKGRSLTGRELDTHKIEVASKSYYYM